ncbi:MAG: methylmalonyl-CoA mutase family protein [Polaribacter sp.]|nr:methylmalonyl-CoA mutase family protein [Polaribacter sp.]
MPRKSFEHITLKKTDFKNQHSDYTTREHEDFIAGIAPNLRGSNATMYITKPWVIIQNASFSSAEENNAFYRKNVEAGLKELFVAFDLATQNGYDSDHERAQSDVGKAGVAIDSVEDMKVLFDTIPLDEISISLPMNKTILPILAFYIVAAEEQGFELHQLSGTFQNDVLKEITSRNTDNYTPSPSMKIIADIFEYTKNKMPKFNAISISDDHLQEAGATAEIELAYMLAEGLEHIKKNIETGISMDRIAPKLSFFWAIGMDHFTEIAKLRAARMLWAKIVNQFNPKDQKSLALKIHCQTSSWSLTAQDPFNNVARTTIEAMAAVFGGTESLHINTFDEAIASPTDFSAQLALNTQLFLQQETQITKTVDPWAGSFHLEKLTEEIAHNAWTLNKEIEDLGGMTKAIEKGIPQVRIEEAAVKKQARIDSGKDLIVGVNSYPLKHEDSLPIKNDNNEALRKTQIERLHFLKANRNTLEVQKSLENITNSAKSGNENLLEQAVIAARERATLGEISDALAIVFGRH